MEKYLLFAYADYYPCGGMEDCVLVANSIEELNLFIPQYIKEHGWCTDNMHYYDCQTGRTYEAEEFYMVTISHTDKVVMLDE